jgi:hypothetical protein
VHNVHGGQLHAMAAGSVNTTWKYGHFQESGNLSEHELH